DNPPKGLLPAGDLADHVGGGVQAIGNRIVNQASPGEMLFHTQVAGTRHVLAAVLALSREQKVRLRNPVDDDARGIDQVRDALLRNHPTGLRDYRYSGRDAVAKTKRGSVSVGGRQIDAVIDS